MNRSLLLSLVFLGLLFVAGCPLKQKPRSGQGILRAEVNHWASPLRLNAPEGLDVIEGGRGDSSRGYKRCFGWRTTLRQAKGGWERYRYSEGRWLAWNGSQSDRPDCLLLSAHADLPARELATTWFAGPFYSTSAWDKPLQQKLHLPVWRPRKEGELGANPVAPFPPGRHGSLSFVPIWVAPDSSPPARAQSPVSKSGQASFELPIEFKSVKPPKKGPAITGEEGKRSRDLEEHKKGKKSQPIMKAKGAKISGEWSAMDKQIAEKVGLLADLASMTDTSNFGSGDQDEPQPSNVGVLEFKSTSDEHDYNQWNHEPTTYAIETPELAERGPEGQPLGPLALARSIAAGALTGTTPMGRLDNGLRLVIVPAEHWTVQDVVALCLAATHAAANLDGYISRRHGLVTPSMKCELHEVLPPYYRAAPRPLPGMDEPLGEPRETASPEPDAGPFEPQVEDVVFELEDHDSIQGGKAVLRGAEPFESRFSFRTYHPVFVITGESSTGDSLRLSFNPTSDGQLGLGGWYTMAAQVVDFDSHVGELQWKQGDKSWGTRSGSSELVVEGDRFRASFDVVLQSRTSDPSTLKGTISGRWNIACKRGNPNVLDEDGFPVLEEDSGFSSKYCSEFKLSVGR
jgi:hypothetical protein